MPTPTARRSSLFLALVFVSLAAVAAALIAGFWHSPRARAAVLTGALPGRVPLTTTTPLPTFTATPCPSAWQIATSPPITNTTNDLTSIDAVSADDIWAAGFYAGTTRPITEHWDGNQWTLVPSAIPTATNNVLWSISALSTNDVWAVGIRDMNPLYEPFAQHWDGNLWSVVPFPSVVTVTEAVLTGVDAIAADDVWAVGRYNNTYALFEHWDGNQWDFDPGADLGGASAFVRSVSGTSPSDVWAVGQYYNSESTVLIEHWDGNRWSLVPNPLMGYGAILNSVYAITPNDVWAVGNSYPGPLVEHWDGIQWSVIPTDVTSGELHSVYALSANDIWMTGYSGPWSNSHALILHWDGGTLTQAQNPDVGATNELDGVVATAPNNVWAVGYAAPSGGNEQQMIQHYSPVCPASTPTATPSLTPTASPTCGLTWHTLPEPLNNPRGLAPLAPDNVWAVGDMGTSRWDGTQWTPGGGASTPLMDISVLSPSDIWSVGYETNGSIIQSVVQHWDGSQWTRIASPNPDPSNNILEGVAALAPNDVWAVGDGMGVIHWDGSGWSQSVPATRGVDLRDISALSANDIWVVGNVGFYTIAMHWNGSTWSTVTTPNPGPAESALTAVAAVSANDVWAVGFQCCFGAEAYHTLIEHWNGTAWSVNASPNQGNYANQLFGLTALSAGDVWAVGYSQDNPGPHRALVERWNGQNWSVVPNSDSAGGELYAVEAISAQDVWAGGNFVERYYDPCVTPSPTPIVTASATPPASMTPTPTATPNCLVDWTAVQSPNPGTRENYLNAVSAISANDIWAVGYYTDDNVAGEQTLTEHWNGTSWSVLGSPNPDATTNELLGVAATSANDAWAVGFYGSGTGRHMLVEHWNGSAWSVVPLSPDPSQYGLYAVTALSASDVWAVGTGVSLHWDGSTWTNVPVPTTPDGPIWLLGVTAIAHNDVWAAGTSGSMSAQHTRTIHWDGAQWRLLSSPDPGAQNAFRAIDAVTTNDIWAVGQYYDAGLGHTRTLTEHWDGTAWSVVPSPNIGSPDNTLAGVAAISSSDVWAVGSSGSDSPLIVHWDGTQWSLSQDPAQSNTVELNGISAISPSNVWTAGSAADTLVLHYSGPPCSTPTATATASMTPTPTTTPGCFGPACSTPTATTCAINFTDVQPSDYFYVPVQYLYCHGAISGYSDGTFRPYNNTTRGQLSKIVVLAEGWAIDTIGGPHFNDVPQGSAFYSYIETAYNRGVISGYSDGTFRPYNNVTRAQLCKIVVNGEGWPIDTQGGPHFTDVPASDPFYGFIETAYNHAIISGYSDNTFRPGNNATRGQISKIVYNAVTQP